MSQTQQKKTIWIFRHGETDWNLQGRMQGGTDIPLNQTGRFQAESLREFFRNHPVEVFLGSDLGRVRETVGIANQDLKVPEFFDPRLRETNLGQAEGMLATEIDARFGAGTIETWRESSPAGQGLSFRFPQGETKGEHLARTLKALEEFVAQTVCSRIGVGSHGGAMRRLVHHFNPDLTAPAMIPNCSVFRISLNSGVWKMEAKPSQSPQLLGH